MHVKSLSLMVLSTDGSIKTPVLLTTDPSLYQLAILSPTDGAVQLITAVLPIARLLWSPVIYTIGSVNEKPLVLNYLANCTSLVFASANISCDVHNLFTSQFFLHMKLC